MIFRIILVDLKISGLNLWKMENFKKNFRVGIFMKKNKGRSGNKKHNYLFFWPKTIASYNSHFNYYI